MTSFTDSNYRSIADQNGFVDLSPERLDPPPAADDTLKVSHSDDVHVGFKEILNSGEDCVDLVRVNRSVFQSLTLWPFGRNGITIKGASADVFFTDLKFERHGRECDIELGQFDNYWYPGRAPTQLVTFFGRGMAFDGDALRVKVWDAEVEDEDFQIDSGVDIKRIPKWVWYPYFLFRYTQIGVTNVIRKFRKQELIKTS
jgi:hypothetical protein